MLKQKLTKIVRSSLSGKVLVHLLDRLVPDIVNDLIRNDVSIKENKNE